MTEIPTCFHGDFIEAEYDGIKRFIKVNVITEICHFDEEENTTHFKVNDSWWKAKGITPNILLAFTINKGKQND